ncbi:MAG TPA: VOC family protein [Bacillales bacterium]
MSKPQISKIATVEVPVSNLDRSIKWYTEVLDLHLDYKGDQDAMLLFYKKGTPSIFLVETEEADTLSFFNSNTGVTHSVIDFYTADLKGFYGYLKEQNVEVGSYNADPNGVGGFGFKDPDGNSLSACNIDHDQYLPEE